MSTRKLSPSPDLKTVIGEETEAISPFSSSLFAARLPRTLQVLAMSGWEEAFGF